MCQMKHQEKVIEISLPKNATEHPQKGMKALRMSGDVSLS